MGVQAEIVKSEKEYKGKNVIKTQSFLKAEDTASATHIKLSNGSFEPITDKLVIYRREVDTEPDIDTAESDADEEVEDTEKVKYKYVEVKYFDVVENPSETYIIKKTNKAGKIEELQVDPQLYRLVVVMGLNPEGNFYRCADGRYIHKDEVQIPAYKKIEPSDDDPFVGPVRDGKFYIGKEDDMENRRYISHVMIGDKIVDIGADEEGNSNVKVRSDGTSTIKIGDEEVELTERTLSLDKSGSAVFKESAGATTESRYYPLGAKKAKENATKGTKQLNFSFDSGDIDRLYVSGGRTEAIFEFKDGHKEIYLQAGKKPRSGLVIGPNDKVFRVDTISAIPVDDAAGHEGVAYDVRFSGKVEVDKADFNTVINDFSDIQDIVWEFDEEKKINVVKSYRIGNEIVSNIKWEDGKIKSFTITKEDGSTINVDDINAESAKQYKHLVINTVPAQELTDIRFNDSGTVTTVSFKMGAIEVRDAVIVDGKYIGKCTLVYQGKMYKTDLQKDERFKTLATQIAMKVKSDIIPLAPSKLMEKVDGKYRVVADVVQEGPILTESEFAALSDEERAQLAEKGIVGPGVCGAHNIDGLEDAVKRQDDFRKKPFKTVVIDDKNPDQVHELNDFENKYEGTSEFELDPEVIPNVLGHGKIEVVDGKIVIDSKKSNDVFFSLAAFGMGICGYIPPFGILIGLPMIGVAAAGKIAFSAYKAIKKYRINHMDPEQLVQKMQKNAETVCAKNIRKYDRQLRRDIRRCRNLSGPQYEEKVSRLKREYELRCQKEIGKMQIMSEGQLNIPFDLNKKSKLTNENLLGFLMAKRRESEASRGNQEALRAEGMTDENIAKYGSIDQKLELFKQTDEYRNETSHKKRREMIKAKRNELLAPHRTARPVQLGERVDSEGNSVCVKNSNIAMAHVREVMETVETKIPGWFSFDKDAAMPENPVEFKDVVAHKVERDDERRRAFDTSKGAKALERVESLIAEPRASVERAKAEATRVATGTDFEASFATTIENGRIKNEVNASCDRIDGLAENRYCYPELNPEKKSEVNDSVEDLRVDASKAHKQARSACDAQRAAYKREVQTWARADYVAAHQAEFDKFAKTYLSKSENRGKSADTIMWAFVEAAKNGPQGATKAERKLARAQVEQEMRAYQVANNVEELVRADAVCALESGDYIAWVNKHNSDSNNTQLDVNSDLARCAYYAARKSADINVANQFDPTSAGFRENAAAECQRAAEARMVAGTLLSRKAKQEKLAKQTSEIERKSKRAALVEKSNNIARAIREKLGINPPAGKSSTAHAPTSAPAMAK